MELKQDAHVVSAEGKDAGRIERVVLNPQTKEITAIVVRKGVLFTHDKVVPLSMIEATNEGGAVLRVSAGDIDGLQDYESTYYVPVDEEDYRNETPTADVGLNTRQSAEPVYAYPPFGVPWGGALVGGPNTIGAPSLGEPEVVRKTQINIPDNAVALKHGAKVLAGSGEHIGNVDEVLTEPGSRRISHFVLSQGVLFKTRKLIPMDWVRKVTDEQVQLVVGPRALQQLRDYNPSAGSEVPVL